MTPEATPARTTDPLVDGIVRKLYGDNDGGVRVPPAEQDRIRRILLDSLPDDPKWVVWVEGVLDRIAEGDEA